MGLVVLGRLGRGHWSKLAACLGAACLAIGLATECAGPARGAGSGAAAGDGVACGPEPPAVPGTQMPAAARAHGGRGAGDLDDVAEWQRAAAVLKELPGKRVTLLVPAAWLEGPERAAMAQLAIALDGTVAAMAPRLGGDPAQRPATPAPSATPATQAVPAPSATVATPIVVAVEDDFVAQARHTGEIGEAVPATVAGDRADLHLVYHPDDLFAYRVALAGRLIARAGLGATAARPLPPWLERGAALWLAGDWYGRPYRDWVPWVAGAAALPSAAEVLAAGTPPVGPAALWTPVAAALLDHQPGATLAAKLDAARHLSAHEVDAWLDGLAASAAASAASGRSRVIPPSPVAAPEGGGDGVRTAGGAGKGKRWGPAFLRGVSLAMENSLEGGYHAPALDRQLDRLAALGVDSVSLMPFAFEAGPASPHLRMLGGRPESETDVGMIHAVRRARAHGLRTLYKPHVWVGGGSWPGDVAMPDEAAWQAWWRDYRRYVLHHAVLARWAGADLFSVGCELSGTLGRAEDWRRLIAAVRQVYPGLVTYAGNWSGDLERTPFWGDLDLIGVDAYFPLSPDPAAGRAELARGAAAVAARLAAASHAWHRRLLLTEVGFAACRAPWTAPHREGGTPSQADQAAAYTALFQALGRPPWLAGAFVWKAFSGESADRPAGARHHRDEGDADFRFLGRQAEAAIAAYYSRK